jgi:hypothetical protein
MHAERILRGLALAALIGLLALGGCASPSEPTAESVPTAPAGSESEPAGSLGVGDAGTVGPYALTVTEVERLPELVDASGTYDPQIAGAGSEFLVVTVELMNDSDADVGMGPVYFSLKDTAGTPYQAFPTNTQEFIFNMPGPVPAKGTASTRIAYEVPSGSTGYTLTWEPFVEGVEGAKSATWEFE